MHAIPAAFRPKAKAPADIARCVQAEALVDGDVAVVVGAVASLFVSGEVERVVIVAIGADVVAVSVGVSVAGPVWAAEGEARLEVTIHEAVAGEVSLVAVLAVGTEPLVFVDGAVSVVVDLVAGLFGGGRLPFTVTGPDAGDTALDTSPAGALVDPAFTGLPGTAFVAELHIHDECVAAETRVTLHACVDDGQEVLPDVFVAPDKDGHATQRPCAESAYVHRPSPEEPSNHSTPRCVIGSMSLGWLFQDRPKFVEELARRDRLYEVVCDPQT